MNINPISAFNSINRISATQARIPFKGETGRDTFVKTTSATNPSETNNSTEKLEKWLQETDFVNKSLIDVISNKENELGHGFETIVYQIPGNDDYVLKVSKKQSNDNLKDAKPEVHFHNKKEKDDLNVGQAIGFVEYKDYSWGPFPMRIGCVQILKRQEGESLGVPPYAAISTDETHELENNEIPYEDPIRKEKYANSLKTMAELPVSSYENLLDKVSEAYKYGYGLDYNNSNNLLVDKDNQEINPIDMEGFENKPLNLGNLLYMLTNIYYFPTYTKDKDMNSPEFQEVVDYTHKIMDKYFEAMNNKGLKFKEEELGTSYFGKVINSLPFMLYCSKEKLADEQDMIAKLQEKGVL